MSTVESYVAALLIASIVVLGWQLRRSERRCLELDRDNVELEAELRLADRKLRRAQDDLRVVRRCGSSDEDPGVDDQQLMT